MRVAVLMMGSLGETGFTTRIGTMLDAYGKAGIETDVFHLRFESDEALPHRWRGRVAAHVEVPLGNLTARDYLSFDPPISRAAARARLGNASTYDVVQSETTNPWQVAASMQARHKLVTFHDDYATRYRTLARTSRSALQRAVRAWTATKYVSQQKRVIEVADRCWFVSDEEMNRLAGDAFGAKSLVVPNGADDSFYGVTRSAGETGARIVFVGPRSHEANAWGLGWFLEVVWPAVRSGVANATLQVIGTGWDDHAAEPGVTFSGFVSDLPDALSDARLVIVPIRSGSGTKIKAIEAMAAARPVVATQLGAEGLPSSPGLRAVDDPDEYARSIVEWLNDPQGAADAGKANRESVRGFTWAAIWSRAVADLHDLAGRDA